MSDRFFENPTLFFLSDNFTFYMGVEGKKKKKKPQKKDVCDVMNYFD